MIKKYWILLAITFIGLLLRIYHNTDISLWHDEAFSVLMAHYSWGEMFRRLAIDVHPPMYYIALRIWQYIFGEHLWSLRGFSILFCTLTIPMAYFFMKEAFYSSKIAIFSALLIAVNPFQAQYVTEARMYTFGGFFVLLAAYFLVKAMREQRQYNFDFVQNIPNLPNALSLRKRFIWHYVWFALATAVIILTHYYLLFTAMAFGLYALYYTFHHYRWDYKKYVWMLSAFVLVGICFVPWLKVFLSQLKSVSGSYWIPDMNIWSISSTLWSIFLGFANDTNNPTTQKLLVLVTLFTIFFFWRFVRKTDQKEKWLVVLAFVMPFVGSVLFYLKSIHCGNTGANGAFECHGRSVYMDRYFLYAGIFYSLGFAAWLSQIKTKTIGIVMVTVYCLVNLIAINNYWTKLNIKQKPGMHGAAKYLGANVEPGQHVFLGTSFEFFNYKYYQQIYYPTPLPPLLYTGGRSDVSQMSAVEGSALLANSDLSATFEQFAQPGSTEWVIWTEAFGSHKPEVPKNWVQIGEKAFADVRPYNGTVIYVSEFRVN